MLFIIILLRPTAATVKAYTEITPGVKNEAQILESTAEIIAEFTTESM
jgi:hypothetical protein